MCFIFAFGIQYSIASPEEYLFPNESLEQKLIVNTNFGDYTIYSVNNEDLIVIDQNGIVPNEKIEEILFYYFSYNYFSTNNDNIDNEYSVFHDALKAKSDLTSQKALNLFQSLREFCVPVPDIEIIQICIKPTEKIPVASVLGYIITDWDTTLDSFNQLIGEISSFSAGIRQEVNSEEIKEIYKNLIAMEQFLNATNQFTPEQLHTNYLNSNNAISYCSTQALNSTENINIRITQLKGEEKNLSSINTQKLKEILDSIKEIAKFNGDYYSLLEQEKILDKELKQISLEDKKYASDIVHLNILTQEIDKLHINVLDSLEFEKTNYGNKNIIVKAWNKLYGGIKSIFIF